MIVIKKNNYRYWQLKSFTLYDLDKYFNNWDDETERAILWCGLAAAGRTHCAGEVREEVNMG